MRKLRFREVKNGDNIPALQISAQSEFYFGTLPTTFWTGLGGCFSLQLIIMYSIFAG
jgi:hypothetical protein